MISNKNSELKAMIDSLPTRCDCQKLILSAKKLKGITYAKLAQEIGRDKVWLSAAIHGNATMTEEEVTKLCALLGLENYVSELKSVLTEIPMRHAPEGFKGLTTDPTIYRLYEIVNVYGESIKSLIHEEFGDGIMSAIGMQVNFEKKKVEGEDHVIITLDGKFLPYKKW